MMPAFDPDTNLGTDLSNCWNLWLDDFIMHPILSGIIDVGRERALPFFQVGLPSFFRYNHRYPNICQYNNSSFYSSKSHLFLVYKFREANQASNESLDQFNIHLRTLA